MLAHPGHEPAGLADAIENSTTEKLGLTVSCLIRTHAEVHAVTEGNPLNTTAATSIDLSSQGTRRGIRNTVTKFGALLDG